MDMLPLKICLKLLKRQAKKVAILIIIVILPYILLIRPFGFAKHLFNISGYKHDKHYYNQFNSSFLTPCTLPELQLWPEEFEKYFTKPKPLRCSEEENWIYVDKGSYRFSKSAVKKHGKILCEAITLVRGDEFAVLNGERIKPLKDGDKLRSDFSEVRCVAPSGKVFRTLLSGIVSNDKIESRPIQDTEQLNILMFGFDSVSRMTWMRTLPETHKYFTEKLQGTVLEGYNIVGDGTPQALLPILTGKNETQLHESRRGHEGAKTVDGHPWIWKEMTKLGYVTQWGEDGAKHGTFTYRMLGFDKQPVDHYMRPFYIRAEMQYHQNKPYCLGSIPRHVNMLNWILEMYKVYPVRSKFSFLFHSEYSHDGYGELGMADLDLKAFLEYMENVGYLNNTIVILMSDHGARFQTVRSTVQGKYEERMPYFGFRFPKWFEEKHPTLISNFRENAKKLVTPYDIHETLKSIIAINRLHNFTNTSKIDNADKLGKSLLNVGLSKNRTCLEAGIAAHWCTCMQWLPVDPLDSYVKKAAQTLLILINDIVQPHSKHCSKVKLKRIISAVLFRPNDLVLKFKKSQDSDGRNPEFADSYEVKEEFYQVTVETMPGLAKFEATIKFNVPKDSYSVSKTEISRINKYGDQPKCIQDEFPHLRPYCYCKLI